MHLLILPYLDCSDSHAYTISLELCAGFNDSTHKTSLLHFESVILYAPLHKDKLRTTAGDRGGAGLFTKFSKNALLCSRAAIPCRRHFLRKSARIESSSFFSEKKKLKSFEAFAENTAGPAAETASYCGAKQNGKVPCPRTNALASAER